MVDDDDWPSTECDECEEGGEAPETPLCDDSSLSSATSSNGAKQERFVQEEIDEVRLIMSMTLTSKDIRAKFINFFERFGHTFVPSSRVVLPEDKSLLFVNAGMNQFKNIFLGQAPDNKLQRAVNSQKCIRAGGKHNDLDDVGKDVYHHTFFEMLGSWSFGDYFKTRAIDLAWSFLTMELELDPTHFYVTYFDPEHGSDGGKASGLERDDETRDLWLRYLPKERILPGSMKDNFWEMGETGPCGPCTEIHYDRLGRADASHLVNADDPEVIEVWNLVFMQFYRNEDSSLSSLPETHVDTGMGFERLVSIVQRKHSNYDTDIFSPIFSAISELTEVRPYSGKVGVNDVEDDPKYASLVDTAYRVVADHMRTVCVAIADGVLPDNKDRGYVVRRILRRAIRFAKEKLFARCGTLTQLVRPVCAVLSTSFAEFEVHGSNKLIEMIELVVSSEEHQFYRSLSRGSELLSREIEQVVEGGGRRVLPGMVAWKLYNTDGFPLDLTQLMCAEKGIVVDLEGWEAAKADALKASKRKPLNRSRPDDQVVSSLDVKVFEVDVDDLPRTVDQAKYDYSWTESDDVYVFPALTGARVLGVFVEDGSVQEVDCSSDSAALVLDKTCMYAEAGGQMADTGLICVGDDTRFNVVNVIKQDGVVIHFGRILSLGSVKRGDVAEVSIHNERRVSLMRNHTATHLLNFVLAQVLPNVEQRGSVVAHDRLRFDFSCLADFTTSDLVHVEQLMMEYIGEACARQVEEVEFDKIKLDKNVRFLRTERYPVKARLVKFQRDDDEEYSAELCGGTHLANTISIQRFIITNVESVARGVKRIVAVTGPKDAADIAATDKTLDQDIYLLELAFEQLSKENKVLEMIESIGPDVNAILSKLEGPFTSYVFKESARSRLESIRVRIQGEKRKRQTEAANVERARIRDEIEKITVPPVYLVRLVNAIPHIDSVACNESRKVINLFLTGFKQRLTSTAIAILSHIVINQNAIEFVIMVNMPKQYSAKKWIEEIVAIATRRFGPFQDSQCKVGGNDKLATGYGKLTCSIEELLNVAHEVATTLFGLGDSPSPIINMMSSADTWTSNEL